jgi:hypothetical protein
MIWSSKLNNKQGHGPVLDVLLMHHFNKNILGTTSTGRYNAGLVMRWDELTNADRISPCLFEQNFGLNGRDLFMGSDQDVAQIIPGADLTCWVSTAVCSAFAKPGLIPCVMPGVSCQCQCISLRQRPHWCGWNNCVPSPSATAEAGFAKNFHLDKESHPILFPKECSSRNCGHSWKGGTYTGDRPALWSPNELKPDQLQPGRNFVVVKSPIPGGNHEISKSVDQKDKW